MIAGELFPTQVYGLAEGRVCLTWSKEPTLADVDALLEYLALYRKVVEKRAVAPVQSVDRGEP